MKRLIGNWGDAGQGVNEAAKRAAELLERSDPSELIKELTNTTKSVNEAAKKAGAYIDQLQRNSRAWRTAGLTALGLAGAGTLAYQVAKSRREREWRRFLEDNPELAAYALAQHYRKRGVDMPKQAALIKKASAKERLAQLLKSPVFQMAAPALIGTVITGIAEKARKLQSRAEYRSSWERFVEKYPEYKTNPKAREHFAILYDFNPAAAKHPVLVKTILDNMFVWDTPDGAASLSALVGNLANIQKDYVQGRPRVPERIPVQIRIPKSVLQEEKDERPRLILP